MVGLGCMEPGGVGIGEDRTDVCIVGQDFLFGFKGGVCEEWV